MKKIKLNIIVLAFITITIGVSCTGYNQEMEYVFILDKNEKHLYDVEFTPYPTPINNPAKPLQNPDTVFLINYDLINNAIKMHFESGISFGGASIQVNNLDDIALNPRLYKNQIIISLDNAWIKGPGFPNGAEFQFIGMQLLPKLIKEGNNWYLGASAHVTVLYGPRNIPLNLWPTIAHKMNDALGNKIVFKQNITSLLPAKVWENISKYTVYVIGKEGLRMEGKK